MYYGHVTAQFPGVGIDRPPYFDNYLNMESTAAVRALAALAQESRLSIFRLLVAAGPDGLAAGEIGAQLRIAPATLSFHLKELCAAGLAAGRQQGRFIFYAAEFEQMNTLIGFLTENCCGSGAVCAPVCDIPQPGRLRKAK